MSTASPTPLQQEQSLVIFSGGQDSATCLAWALSRFERVRTLGFDYGQRHNVELACRQRLRAALADLDPLWASRLGPDTLLNVDIFRQLADTALTSEAPIAADGPGRPAHHVRAGPQSAVHPARRCLGLCQEYPPSDPGRLPERFFRLSRLPRRQHQGHAGGAQLRYGQPLRPAHAADVAEQARSLGVGRVSGGTALVDLILEESHTCYAGERGRRYDWGYGCGVCPACRLRASGYAAYREARKNGERGRTEV